jgi:hypothetical protein
LKKNVGNQRVYSLDGVLFAPVAGVFSIQHLGEFSAFMPHSFREFSLENLDSGAVSASLVGNAWFRQGNPSALSQVRQNIAFYSLLGVKYFLTAYTDLSLADAVYIESDIPWWESPRAPLGNKSLSAFFTTDRPFDCILVRMVTLDHAGSGTVSLMLDRVPRDSNLHREARISARSVTSRSPVEFTFAPVEIVERTEFKITLVQSDFEREGEVGIVIWPQVRQNPHITVFESFQIGTVTSNGYPALGLGLHEQFLPIVYRDQNVTIYENSMAFPRAFLVDNFVAVRNETEAARKTHELGWDTRKMLVLEEAPSAEELALIRAVNATGSLGSAKIERYSAEEVQIFTDNSPAFLVLTDIYYPGWRCYVDGHPVTIHRAYGTVRAVFVDRGAHTVVFRYEPESFRVGAIVSLASLACMLLLLTRDRVMRIARRRARGDSRNGERLLASFKQVFLSGLSSRASRLAFGRTSRPFYQ